MNNRKWNSQNPHQGNQEKVLCVCSAGLLRSPTVANVMAATGKFNTRAVGLEVDFALIPVDNVLLSWADSIVCMDFSQCERVDEMLGNNQLLPNIYNFSIPDDFEFMQPELVEIVENRIKNMQDYLWS